MMKKIILAIAVLNIFVSYCWADATFNAESDNKLQIPFVLYQGKFFQTRFSYLPPDKLKLESASEQTETVNKANVVPVYDDLSFHLSRIGVADKQYAADMTYLGDNIFQIHNLVDTVNASPGRTRFTSKHFSGSGVCAQCHNDINDGKGNDVSIATAWETTMMANATRDPFWQAKVRSELNRTPSLAEVINDKCTRCHAPMANEEARKQNDPVQTLFGDGLLNKKNKYHNLTMNGVSCSLCHQISPKGNFGTEAGFSGNFAIESFDNKVDRLIYGPFRDVQMGPMRNFASFTPVFSEHIKSSEHCASCHELTTPYSDENGTIISTADDEFPEQTPYSEWLHSDFKHLKSCQQCHMKRSNGVIISAHPPNLDVERNNFAQHGFLGSNLLMLSILQNNREALGVVPKDFSKSLENAGELLSNSAKLTINNAAFQENQLAFSINIDSDTGHKLPSGYPSRRLILHVTVSDVSATNEAGTIVFESGKVNSDGSVVELDSDRDPTQYEPHYDVIDSPQKVQVYETVMHDYKDNVTFTLLRAKSYLKDNRLLPNGFDKRTASNKIKVRGKAATDDDFIGGSDSVHFKIPALAGNKYTVHVELIYQTLGYSFAQDLFKDAGNEISRFKQMFNAEALKSVVIKHVELTVER